MGTVTRTPQVQWLRNKGIYFSFMQTQLMGKVMANSAPQRPWGTQVLSLRWLCHPGSAGHLSARLGCGSTFSGFRLLGKGEVEGTHGIYLFNFLPLLKISHLATWNSKTDLGMSSPTRQQCAQLFLFYRSIWNCCTAISFSATPTGKKSDLHKKC